MIKATAAAVAMDPIVVIAPPRIVLGVDRPRTPENRTKTPDTVMTTPMPPSSTHPSSAQPIPTLRTITHTMSRSVHRMQ
ncbi:MAG TPA: hypothetical protein VF824_00860 [Thermoanaerobaculia bacterium]